MRIAKDANADGEVRLDLDRKPMQRPVMVLALREAFFHRVEDGFRINIIIREIRKFYLLPYVDTFGLRFPHPSADGAFIHAQNLRRFGRTFITLEKDHVSLAEYFIRYGFGNHLKPL